MSQFTIKRSPGDWVFDIFNMLFMTFVLVVTLYPFLNVLAISLNDATDSIAGGIFVFPRKPTFSNYIQVFQKQELLTGFIISILRTLVGTLLSVFACSMVAFTLSRKDFMARKFISKFLAITMYVSGGLIPGYLLIKDLGLMSSFWVYVLPGMVSAFNVFMIRSFMEGLPYELQESAKIDGANDFVIFWKIVMPLCKPVLATIALFVAVGQWNSWFDAYLYNSGVKELTTLQFELQKVLLSAQATMDKARTGQLDPNASRITPDAIKMAITIVTVVPILMVYPFLQRYFVKGMTLGAVKS